MTIGIFAINLVMVGLLVNHALEISAGSYWAFENPRQRRPSCTLSETKVLGGNSLDASA